MKLSEIKHVKPDTLKPNEKNMQYFKAESGEYFRKLSEDIKVRGILVPLVAKSDGILLAGHNRLLIAKALEMKTVPVQLVVGKLTAGQELEYILKDNLLRRHLAPDERFALYRALYKNFDERVILDHAGEIGINARDIAEKTGLNPQTVNYDISRIKHQKRKEAKQAMAIDLVNYKAIEKYKRALAKMLNVAIIEHGKTLVEFKGLTEKALNQLRNMEKCESGQVEGRRVLAKREG